jgi:putative transcriptional regulator
MRHIRLWTLLLIIAAPLTAYGQGPASGQLLVANPAIPDPNFRETVLLLLQHDAERGSLAVFLNRPTWLEPAEVFPETQDIGRYPGRLFRGGPVSPTQLLLLLEFDAAPLQNMTPIIDSVYLSADLTPLRNLDLTAENAPRVRLYAGYAVWSPGQLEDEIAAGSWRVLRADSEDVFADDPETQWRRMPSADDAVSAALR